MMSINLPTRITLLRLLLVPFVVTLYFLFSVYSHIWIWYLLFLVFVFQELTDILDGYFSRKYNQVTNLGKLLDPLVDTLYHLSICFCLTQEPVGLPVFVVLPLLYTEFMKAYVRIVCATVGEILSARLSGKIKCFMMVLVIMWYWLTVLLNWEVSVVPMVLLSVFTIYSLIDYLYASRKIIKKFMKY